MPFRSQLTLVAVAVLASARLAAAETAPPIQTIAFDETFTIDRLGDATISIAFTMTAAQWVNWQMKYGQNKSLLKRDIGKLVSQYDTYNWNVQTNEMERRVMVTVSAHGAVKYRGGGQYELDVPKDWRGGQVRGNVIDYNWVESLGVGVVGQHNVKVNLPSNARKITQASGESSEPVVRYAVPVPGRGVSLGLLIPGVGLLLIGGALVAFAYIRRRPAGGAVLRPVPSIGPPATATGRG